MPLHRITHPKADDRQAAITEILAGKTVERVELGDDHSPNDERFQSVTIHFTDGTSFTARDQTAHLHTFTS